MFGRMGRRNFGRGGALSDRPFWTFPMAGATWDMDFVNGRYFGKANTDLTVTRASLGTDLLPTSPGATTFTSFANNTARITPGSGLLIEESRTNSFTNSTAPATQTCTMAVGTWVLWCNSTGAGTVASAAGTAIGSGFGTASQGSAVTITITTSGTAVFTVSGTVTAVQLEKMPGTIASPSSLIQSSAAAATRSADNVTITSVPSFTSMSIYASGMPIAAGGFATTQTLFALSDGTANNRLLVFRQGGTGLAQGLSETGGATSSMNSPTVLTSGVGAKMAAASNAGLSQFAINASKPIGAAPTAIPAGVNVAQFGMNGAGAGFWNGYIERVGVFATAFSSGQIASITGGPLP